MIKIITAFIFLCSSTINSLTAQTKLMYLNTDDATAGNSNNADFVRSVGRLQLASFGTTNIYDIGNYNLLFYNINNGKGLLIERESTAAIKSDIPFAAGWTNIVKLNRSRILFYNNVTGKALVTKNSDFTTIDEPGFSPWTHITPINEDMLCFYNSNTGITLVTDMNFNNLSPVSTIAKGYTQVVDIDNDNILFYNAANGNNLTYRAANFELIYGSKKAFSTGWTNIVNAGDSKILFYNKNNNATAVLDNTLTIQTNIGNLEKCHQITAYKSTNEFQESMVGQTAYVGGTVTGVIHLSQDVLQNSNIWAKYTVNLYEVTDHPTDGTKYKYRSQIKIENTATKNDLPAGSNSYDVPFKFTKVPLYKKFIVVYGNDQDMIVKVDLRKPEYVAVDIQKKYSLIGGFYKTESEGCKSCGASTFTGFNAYDTRVRMCTKANPNLVNDMSIGY